MIYSRNSVLLTILINLFILNTVSYAASADSTEAKHTFTDNEKTINKIYIDNIDVSGPSLEDGNEWEPGIFGRVGNALHFKTRVWVIRNILLFKTGENLDIWKVNESERLLRKSGYFYDAKINIDDSEIPGKVDIRVITKDKWTLNPYVSYNLNDKRGYLGFKDKNFLGLGHSAEMNVNYNQDPYIGWGGEWGYTISNIKGSYVNASAGIESDHKSNMIQLNLNRSFYTVKAQWAGGLDFIWEHDDLKLIDANNNIILIPNSFDSQDLWIGRSFPVWFGSEEFRNNSSFIISGRYFLKHFRLRPEVLPDSNRIFENNRLYLFSSGVIHRRFYKSFFVDDFGVTEDIPVGGLISFTTGSDDREFYNRWYYGMQIIYSAYFSTIGYFSGDFQMGGYHYHNNWEQNTIKLDFNYHSPLFLRNQWKARFFLQNNYIAGFNRFDGEQIYLDRGSGMPGFEDLVLPGTKRNVLKLEMRIFSPWSVLGFVIGGTTFANYGLISGANTDILSSRLYQGYGIGLRTKNESISETKYEIALVYNPFNPSYSGSNPEIIFSASFALGSRYFNFDEPKTVKFGDDY